MVGSDMSPLELLEMGKSWLAHHGHKKGIKKRSLEKQKILETKMILWERAVTAFASPFYDVGDPF